MLNKYRLFQRANGVFYWQDNESAKQGSLRTKDRRAAEKLLHAKNDVPFADAQSHHGARLSFRARR